MPLYTLIIVVWLSMGIGGGGSVGLPEFKMKFPGVLTSLFRIQMLKPLPQLTRFWQCVLTLGEKWQEMDLIMGSTLVRFLN